MVVGPIIGAQVMGMRLAMVLSVIPGLLAALAIVYDIRHIPQPARRERQPIRLQFGPVLRGGLGRGMVGVTAFEVGNVAARLFILRARTLLEPSSKPE
jgi:hypothetical protein